MSAPEVVTKEQILRAAAELLREKGAAAVNARAVAQKLNCSTQPLYRHFGGMEKLKAALRAVGQQAHKDRVGALLQSGACKPYEAYGLGFVIFAREERNFFRFLFADRRSGRKDIEDVNLPEIIETVCREYGYDEATARAFHADMAIYSYGLAFLVNTGYADYADGEIIARLKTEFTALTKVYGAPAVKGD